MDVSEAVRVMADVPVIFSLGHQLLSIPAPVPQRERFNPRPSGVIRDGSASDAVLQFLRVAGGFKTEAQIIWKVGRSHAAISWALLYLRRQGLVEARPDLTRSSRYKKYRAVRFEDADCHS